MVKTERKKDLLEQFQYEKIKGDVSYSSLMKKTGSNGKGFLDRYFLLHRNYVIYYKPGKGNIKPDDKQEPQGYINLKECIYEDTKEQKEPLQFQIAHKHRIYIIKAKDDSTKNQFLTLLKTRIKALSLINVDQLGSPEKVQIEINEYKEKLPNPLILPDRVSPDKAKDWVNEMRNYNIIFQKADPHIKQVEQFSEYCKDGVKDYVDWFSGPEGPRLAMIRCEETVLTNWVEYITKTKNEIASYEDTRYFKEDYSDITKHLKNMLLLIEAYHDYMRTCRKNTKPTDRFLEEKALFDDYITKYSRIQSCMDFKLDDDLVEGVSTITCIGEKKTGPNNSVIGLSSSNSSICSNKMSFFASNQDGNYPTVDLMNLNSDSMPFIPDTSSEQGNRKYDSEDEKQPDEASTAPSQSSLGTLEKWEYSNNSLIKPDNGREEVENNNGNGSSLNFDPRWDYSNGYFKSKNMGVVLWNGKSWVWSHIKTSYKIRFDWIAASQTFTFVSPKPRTGLSLSVSSQSNSSTSSLSSLTGSNATKKSNHPATIYPDWQIKDNGSSLISIVSPNKNQTTDNFSHLESNNKIPPAVLLLVAMTPHIQKSLYHIGIGPKYITNN
ncbi:hypothetical protein DICPUDRAFT_49184 [Dictyostelium purpureum]|uniref:PH domain-containing protein n=1 Tax=Dictyostelium purpureum TaxID=5786 RepID=F0ZSN1_DICPU|nr:uncharacterized protein DICPUDRAFT_49184 [Dictyostelium purpureum]EGC33047.1 hypothetical protein DICPUDRAFT_49184 [Dictyostelium purpureum]|eukprot:XP_003290436.1 hypothetical protein DICPUDRAFT_49184 [Dictyostelium purpureum]